MPQLDLYHETVKRALVKDGWTISHDPFPLAIGRKRLYVDLGAHQLISAEKGPRRIAVEIKSFVGTSDVRDLEVALGQYVLYGKILNRVEPERILYLAIPQVAFVTTFQIELGAMLLEDQTIRAIVFDDEKEEITQWIPPWTAA